MNSKSDMVPKKKSLIAVVAAVLVITMLIVIIFTKSVLSTSANDDATRHTERIKAENITETSTTENPSTAEQTQPQTEQTQPQAEQPQPANNATPQDESINADNNDIISSERAKKIALDDAGLSESQVTMSRVKCEWDDGVQVYDVEFYSGGMEYEYEIEASSGTILEKDVDD